MSLHSSGLGGVSSLAPGCMYYHSVQLMSKMGSVTKVTRVEMDIPSPFSTLFRTLTRNIT